MRRHILLQERAMADYLRASHEETYITAGESNG